MAAGVRRWFPITLLAVVTYGTQFARALPASAEDRPTSELKTRTVVARVNGQAIYQDELSLQVQKELRKFRKFETQEPPADLVKRLSEKALERLIAVELLYQASRTFEIPDIDQRIDKKAEAMRKGHASGQKETSDPAFRESVRRQIYVHEYLQVKGLADPEIPEQEIRDYYEENKQAFASRGYVHARHILRTVAADAKPEEREEARHQIEEARRLVLEGRPFAEVAKKYSQCNSAQTGGDLGPREKGYMPPEFDAVAFSIEKGKLSDVVETKFGYHILEVLERTPEGTVSPYEQVRDLIARFLKKQAAPKKTSEHVRHLREKAKIEVFLP